MMVSADCSTARESFRRGLLRGLLFLCKEWNRQSVADRADQGCAVQLRLGHAVPGSAFNDFGDCFFVRIFGQENRMKGIVTPA